MLNFKSIHDGSGFSTYIIIPNMMILSHKCAIICI